MMLTGTGIRVNKMVIRETGTYSPQFRRPYESHLDNSVISAFNERVGGQNRIMGSGLAGIASAMVTPSATPEHEVWIPNGWNERRMMFMLEVCITETLGGSLTEIIQGYTDFPGVNISGSIAPDMEFVINSIIQIRNTVEYTPMGPVNRTNVTDVSHLLVASNWQGAYSPHVEEKIRPEDIFSLIGQSDMFLPGEVVNTSAQLTNVASKSKRANGIATSYVSNILQNYKSAYVANGFNSGFEELLGEARGYACDGAAALDSFLMAISQVRGMPVGNVFRFGDLHTLDQAGTINNTIVQTTGQLEQVTRHQVGQTQHWQGTDRTTQTAAILAQAIPAIMSRFSLGVISISTTNRTMDGSIATAISNVRCFTNVDATPLINAFIAHAEREVLFDISMGNQTDFAIEMQVDLLGETWIKVSVDGGPVIDYVMPSFADALAVPVVTSVKQSALSLANDFHTLLSATIGGVENEMESGFGAI